MQTSGNIDDLVARVMEKAEAEASTIIERAERVAALDVSRAREAGAHKLSIDKSLFDEQLKAKHEAVRAEISIHERRLIMARQEQAIDKVFAESLKQLIQINDVQEHRLILLRLLKESVAVLGVNSIRVKLNRVDKELAVNENLFAELDTVTVLIEDETIDVAGGILVSDDTGRLVHDNTFESRLERQRGELRAQVAEILGFRKADKS